MDTHDVQLPPLRHVYDKHLSLHLYGHTKSRPPNGGGSYFSPSVIGLLGEVDRHDRATNTSLRIETLSAAVNADAEEGCGRLAQAEGSC